jgi:hypothetical protein
LSLLQEARRQVQQLQSKAQMTEGYVLMINKLRNEVAEYVIEIRTV